jgi:hypothetical protein
MFTIFKNILIFIALFLYIYSPPFRILPLNISVFFIFPAFYFLIKRNKFVNAVKDFQLELFLLFLLTLYSLLISVFNSEYFFFINNLFFVFQLIPISIWFYFIIEKSQEESNNATLTYFFKSLSYVAVVASVISALAFAIPELSLYLKFTLQKYDEFLLRYQSHRGFGLSDELLFSFTLVQAIILLIIIYTEKSILFKIISFLFITFSIILNARIGLIFLFFLPFFLLRKNVLFNSTLALILFLLLFKYTNIYDFLEESIGVPLEFASSFFLEAGDLFGTAKTDNETAFDSLFGSMLVFPTEWYEVIFGTGKNIFFSNDNYSDIGYLMILNFGGILYFSLFILFTFFFFKRLFISNDNYPLISYILLFVFLIANIKGLFFAPKPGMKLVMLIYVFFVLSHKKLDVNAQKLI